MKKVVLASLLASAVFALGLSSTFAQTPVQLGSQQDKPIQMGDAELTLYNNAIGQSDPKAKAAAVEAYLTAYPQSAVKQPMLEILMAAYGAIPDMAKTHSSGGPRQSARAICRGADSQGKRRRCDGPRSQAGRA
jgi:hypothetical protein